MRRHKATLASLLPFLALCVIRAADLSKTNTPTVLPPVTILGTNQPRSLTSPSQTEAARQKTEVPGALTIRGTEAMRQGRGSSLLDLLGGIPGLTLQSENGMEVSKVSVRGSGILSEDEPVGVEFLLDGFPFNQGDGEVILEDFDFGGIQYAEVFRGANAFKYGAITLGGAVNLVSRTGYDATPFSIRAEGGSYGFVRGEVTSGGVEGPSDYFVSITGRDRDGYRDHSRENTEDLFANFGYKLTTNLENRVYFSLARTDRQLPEGITEDEMYADPRQVDPLVIAQDTSKQWSYLRLADKLTFKTDVEQADAGGYWWHRNLYERDLFTADSPDGIQGYYSDNLGFSLDSVTRTEPFGRNNILTLGFSPTWEREMDTDWENVLGQKGPLDGQDGEVSINAPLYAEDQQYLTEKLSIQAGIQAIYAQRNFVDYFTGTPDGDQSTDLAFRTVNPKVGAIYELDSQSQLYANLSRSWQPPSFDNMVDFANTPPPFASAFPPLPISDFQAGSLVFTPLEPQHAWTAEVGTRGEEGRFGWELSFYRSWVRDELLDINDALGQDRGAVNINRSYHQGIEAGLDIELLDSMFVRMGKGAANDRLTLEQTYTFNDFHFDADPVYGNNRIGGVPIHLYHAELLYKAPCGFYAGPDLDWNITPYPVDHANNLFADPYALLGFKTGIELKNGFSAFIEAKNLTDARYPASVDPIPDARTADGPIEIFHPGDGRSFYGGISWTL
jgi:iron complex outermembrane receptor protein